MTRVRTAALCLSIAALASCASNGPHPAKPASAPVVQSPPPPDAPIPRDEFLGHFAGDWEVTRSMRRGITHCRAEVRWVLGDRWLSLHLEPPIEPPSSGRLPYEAIVFIGFDGERGEYIAYWHDTFGARYGFAGRGQRHGNAVEFCFEEDDRSSVYNTFTYEVDADTWTSVIENKPSDGGRTFFARETYRRRQSP